MNDNFEFIREKISNKEIFSLFILDWNSIYEISETGYRKDMIKFNNEKEYKLFIDDIKRELEKSNEDFLDKDTFRVYIENYNNKDHVTLISK